MLVSSDKTDEFLKQRQQNKENIKKKSAISNIALIPAGCVPFVIAVIQKARKLDLLLFTGISLASYGILVMANSLVTNFAINKKIISLTKNSFREILNNFLF